MTKSGWSRVRPQEELKEALTRQLGHFRRSIAAYDEGIVEEAERLAASAYILLHDGRGKTKSLLGQLGLLKQMQFPDSRPPELPEAIEPGIYVPPGMRLEQIGGTLRAGLPLCKGAIDAGNPVWTPRLDDEPRRGLASFSDWYDRHDIYETARGLPLTRKNLIFALRSKDGGAHVDGEIDDRAYDWLKAKGDDAIYVDKDGQFQMSAHVDFEANTIVMNPPPPGSKSVRNGHWASMRQIAWELEEALQRAGL